MQPLTHQVWEQHFAELRQPILARFPQVDPEELQVISDDYDGLLALVQRATGMDADRALEQIRALDVEELGIGTGGSGNGNGNGAEPDKASLDQLSLHKGFAESERGWVVERLSQLNRQLKRFRADGTYLELSVKDRDSTQQVVTLEAEVPGLPRFVSKSNLPDLRDALADARDDMIKQISREVDKRTRGAK
jgi:hypothetical protein